eukprot:scaffold57324_cov66-Phaeocystis_antarctica.AAC.1
MHAKTRQLLASSCNCALLKSPGGGCSAYLAAELQCYRSLHSADAARSPVILPFDTRTPTLAVWQRQ